MRLLASVALVSALAASSLSGCLPIGGCGAFDGNGDVYLTRGNDSLMLCANGGFVLKLDGSAATEGRFADDGTTSIGTYQDTSEIVFYLTDSNDTAPELGTGAWTRMDLDQTALDHADVQCSDLETRAWWTADAAQ
ncbi:MAG TPA: hypothetical protein VGM88_06235 [Kofleriaceae bacterium]|jgi:hypothetical protein